MGDQARLYVAGIGMITPVGFNTAMTVAAVAAGMSAYRMSTFYTRKARQPMTMATIPAEVFQSSEFVIDEGAYYGALEDRIIKMALLALREAIGDRSITRPIPLILATPEPLPTAVYADTETIKNNLAKQAHLPLHAGLMRLVPGGRPAAIEALTLARHLLYQQKAEYVLVGGSDSHWNARRMGAIDEADRGLTPESKDGFAPGEGAAFLLLTGEPACAIAKDRHIVAFGEPGLGNEPGHFHSSETYRGEGLDQAFKQALRDCADRGIHTIYSSMNGEGYWAKEYGVAYIRNKEYFHGAVKLEHPADCYGDLGSATAPVLLGLAAAALFQQSGPASHLVYSAADGPLRAAVRVEKLPYA